MMPSGWMELALAFALFLASHSVPVQPAVRRRLVGWLGERGYLLGFSLVSILALALLIAAAGRAPYVELWPAEIWHLRIPHVAMLAACLLIALSVGVPNPLSFGGGSSERFDPDRPGIVGVTRHPLLWALVLWALSHTVANGDLSHVLVFGGFAGFALLGMSAIDRRLSHRMGKAEWQRLSRRTSVLPFGALLSGRWRPQSLRPSADVAVRVLAAFVLYVSLLMLHEPVIGVPVAAGHL